MGAEPLPVCPSYTRAEVVWSEYVARALWALSFALLMLLAAWSAGPQLST